MRTRFERRRYCDLLGACILAWVTLCGSGIVYSTIPLPARAGAPAPPALALDPTFGYGGRTIVPGGVAGAVAMAADGKILVAGGTFTADGIDWTLARFAADGTLDPTFGAAGVAVTPWPHNSLASALLILPDGKILAAGLVDPAAPRPRVPALVRYGADGSLDPGFGSAGKLLVAAPAGLDPLDLALQPDGKLVVATLDGPGVSRFNQDGSLDPGFGAKGVASGIFARLVALAPADKIVLVDGVNVRPGCDIHCYATDAVRVRRLNPDGTVDTGFNNGSDTVQSTNPVYSVDALTVRADGAAFVGGSTAPGFAGGGPFAWIAAPDEITPYTDGIDPASALLALPAAILAASGATGGWNVTAVPGAALHTALAGVDFARPAALARQSDGKVVVVGSANGLAVARYLISPAPAPPSPTPVAFADVHSADYFYLPVQDLVMRGAISGYGDNTFRPFNFTTRGQLAKIVALAKQWALRDPARPSFADVPPDSPVYRYVETAVAAGLVSGYDQPEQCAPAAAPCFKPGNNVTRGQLAKIIVLAQNWPPAYPPRTTFADVSADNPFFGWIEAAAQHDIIGGYGSPGGREFRPGNPATRGQIAKIVSLAVQPPALVTAPNP